MVISRAAVVGAGAMGGGIAQVITRSGVPVVLKDIDPRQLEAARAHITGIYRRRVERGRMTADAAQEMLGLVDYTLRYEDLRDVDIVVEAVPEDVGLKNRVLAELDRICPAGTILATNTSALSVSEMGEASGRPGKVIGMHFFNPAHVMKLVEVVPGRGTDPATVEAVVTFARKLGKVPVVVRECPGFLVNRLLMPYLNEAVICLQQGTATVDEIDAAMGRAGFGWPMGPCALMDMLGTDVCHHIIAYLASEYGGRIQEAALLKALFDRGRYGEKASKGFYDYPGRRRSAKVGALIEELRSSGGAQTDVTVSSFSADRLMAALLNEAFMCVEEEIASVDDVDVACVTGLGMQVRMGEDLVRQGPLEYADGVGLNVILDRLRQFESTLGPRFRPAAILERKVREGNLGKASGRGFRTYAG